MSKFIECAGCDSAWCAVHKQCARPKQTDDKPNTPSAVAACQKCGGSGFYSYDHNHAKLCEDCCPCDEGWWLLRTHYGESNGKYACKRGCGKSVWPEELGLTAPQFVTALTAAPVGLRAGVRARIIAAHSASLEYLARGGANHERSTVVSEGMTFTERCRKMLIEQPDRTKFTLSRSALEVLVTDSERYAERNADEHKANELAFLGAARQPDGAKGSGPYCCDVCGATDPRATGCQSKFHAGFEQ